MSSFRGFLFTWCAYISLITWGLCASTTTPAEAAAVAGNCIINTAEFNGTFDLGRLRSESTLKYSAFGFSLEFNVCGGTVPGNCSGQAKVTACYRNKTSGGKDRIVGREAAGVAIDNHVPTFEFVGEECTKDKKYSMTLQAICDYAKVKDPITLVRQEECHYLVQYRSPKACLKASKPAKCQFALENKKLINFASVSTENQYVETKDQLFIINACNPVVYGPKSVCPPDTNVCVLNQTTGKASRVGTDLQVLSKGKFTVLKYSSDTKCETDPKMNMSATIDLKCDLQQDEKISYKETVVCNHIFEWYSPLACETTEQCVVTDNTGFKYDLRPLSNTPFNVSSNNNTLFFGICASFHPCNESMGICNEHKGLGYLNQDLKINETGFPYLEYIDGTCNDGENSSTKIEFRCAKDATEDNQITVLEDTGCRVIIQLATKLACPEDQISCTHDFEGKEYSLIPLMDSIRNYEAVVADGVLPKDQKDVKFYLNVCRDLVAQPGLSCHGGSAVCRANMVNEKPENETSLGYPEVSLTVINTTKGLRPQIKYLKGDACPGHLDETLDSTIEFSCNEKVGRGRPVLTGIVDGCQYMFDWETNVLCPKGLVDYDATKCSLTNSLVNGSFNLKEVESGGKLAMANNETLDLCDLKNYTAEINYFSQLINLKIRNGSNAANLRLQCGSNRTNLPLDQDGPTTTFISTSVCRLFAINGESTLQTSVVPSTSTVGPPAATKPTTEASKVINSSSTAAPSAPTSPSSPTKDNTATAGASALPPEAVPAARSGMSAWGITGVLFLICAVLVLVGFVMRSPQRRTRVLSLFRRKNVAVSYTRVSNEEASSLLMTPAGLSESDDELLV